MRLWSSAARSGLAYRPYSAWAYYSECYNGAGVQFSAPAEHPCCCYSARGAH